MESSTAGDLAGVAALLVGSALFTASEAGLLGASVSRLRARADRGHVRARLAVWALRRRAAFLAVVLFGITASNYTAERLATELALRINPIWGPTIAAVVMTLVILLFCEVIPIHTGARAPESTICLFSPFLATVGVLLAPLVAALWLISRAVLWLMGVQDAGGPDLSERQLRAIIDAGRAHGALDEGERLMLHRALGFSERTAGQVMTPRTEVVAVEVGTPVAEAVRTSLEAGHSRLPVYHDRIDDVVGVFYLKDALQYIRRGQQDTPVEDAARPPIFVPDSLPADQLLRRLQSVGRTIAIVKDEFGGTAGIVTVEDLLEEIVGAIQDEYDFREQPEIVNVAPDQWLCSGLVNPHIVEEAAGAELPEAEYDTIGGLIIAHLGHLPSVGDTVTVGRLELTVERMYGTRVERVRVRRLPRTDDNNQALSPENGRNNRRRGRRYGG